jgi:hypothetical protein
LPRVERRSWLLAPPPRRRPAPGPAAPRAPWDDAGPRRRKLPASCRGSRARRRTSSEVRGPLGWQAGPLRLGRTIGNAEVAAPGVTRPRMRPIAASIASIGPAGIQALRSARPPQRMTRLTSRRASAGWGAKITTKTERTTSAVPSSSGRSRRSPSRKSTSTPCARARSRATSSSRGAASIPTTRAPPTAASSAAFPVPHAKSMTWSAGDSAAISTTACATGSSSAAVPRTCPLPSRPPPDHDARNRRMDGGMQTTALGDLSIEPIGPPDTAGPEGHQQRTRPRWIGWTASGRRVERRRNRGKTESDADCGG